MSELYSIKDTTLTALGDAVRSKTSKYIYKEEIPAEPVYSIDFDSADYDMTQWKNYAGAYPPAKSFRININLKELLGDKVSMYEAMPTGRPKLLINFTYESNMTQCLIWEFCVVPSTGGLWNARYVGMSSTFLTREFVNKLEEPSNINRNLNDSYYISLRPLVSAINDGFHFKFHFDIRVATSDDKYVYLNTYTPLEMAEIINGLEIPNIEPIVLTGSQSYACASEIATQFINNFKDKVSTDKITSTTYMFYTSKLESVPFEINMDNSTYRSMANTFSSSILKELPKINNAYPDGLGSLFSACYYLREIPEDYFDGWNFSRCQSYTYANNGSIFSNCSSLRKIPDKLLKELWGIQTSSSYISYYYFISRAYVMDEVVGLVIHPANLTSNIFNSSFEETNRLKNMMFVMNEDGTAKTAAWKNQTIDLSKYVGYTQGYSKSNIYNYNSGITADKEVTDDATYQALKNDPDWFSADVNYSRYNHTSAVNTINSLPDCSASGGTNTIKFKGAAGALTDGGAINTLTEEEIAVATAKGWTVSFV